MRFTRAGVSALIRYAAQVANRSAMHSVKIPSINTPLKLFIFKINKKQCALIKLVGKKWYTDLN